MGGGHPERPRPARLNASCPPQPPEPACQKRCWPRQCSTTPAACQPRPAPNERYARPGSTHPGHPAREGRFPPPAARGRRRAGPGCVLRRTPASGCRTRRRHRTPRLRGQPVRPGRPHGRARHLRRGARGSPVRRGLIPDSRAGNNLLQTVGRTVLTRARPLQRDRYRRRAEPSLPSREASLRHRHRPPSGRRPHPQSARPRHRPRRPGPGPAPSGPRADAPPPTGPPTCKPV